VFLTRSKKKSSSGCTHKVIPSFHFSQPKENLNG